jgi:diadenosine tetraphosphatase ApaH/serine/threonine PP2A family protein phosphatase
MLTALLTDIHGNREALDACLAHATRMRAERFIFLGDLVGYGADPAYVVDRVASQVERGAIALRGNHDDAVSGSAERMNHLARTAIEWTRGRLDPAQRAFLSNLPLTAEEDGRLFVHASAYAPSQWSYVTDVFEAERSFASTACDATFCGHTHVPAVFRKQPNRPALHVAPVAGAAIPLLPDWRWLAVIGAVGQPRDGDPAACYALLDDERDVLTYVRVPYDVESAARKILDAGLPPHLATRLLQGW